MADHPHNPDHHFECPCKDPEPSRIESAGYGLQYEHWTFKLKEYNVKITSSKKSGFGSFGASIAPGGGARIRAFSPEDAVNRFLRDRKPTDLEYIDEIRVSRYLGRREENNK